MTRPAYVAVAVLLFGCGCAEEPAAPPPLSSSLVVGTRALEEVRSFVAQGPRDSGTPGAAKAAAYLRDRLLGMGLAPEIDEFTEVTPLGPLVFRNVHATVDGGGAGLIVLGSHYDTKRGMPAGFEGANDSGSSTGLLIELGRALIAGGWRGPDVLLAFLDGEECIARYGAGDGLHGSRRLARALKTQGRAPSVRAVIILDMIGDKDLTITLPRNCTSTLLSAVFEAAREEGVRSQFALAKGGVIDDHVPFLEQGMPALDIIDFEFGSAPGRNDYWHTAEDTMDKVSAESLETVGRVVVRLLERIAREAL